MTARPVLKRFDVAVLGSGAAGLLAATEAAIQGARTVVLTKGQVGRSGATATITGDISVDGATIKRLGLPGNAADSVEQFYEDTLVGGGQINDPVLAQAMIERVGAEVGPLLEAGLKVSGIGHAPGHRYPRGVLVSGMQMLQILTRNAIKAGVLFRDEFYATDVLVGDDGAVTWREIRGGEPPDHGRAALACPAQEVGQIIILWPALSSFVLSAEENSQRAHLRGRPPLRL